jgi:uncharacterized SAM-binding protein YcdF (DUF218 family)
VLDLLARLLERPLRVAHPLEPLDAIVVLGARLGPGGTLTPWLAERVAAAAQLYQAGAGRLVVATGGITARAPRAEAAAIAEALVAARVPEHALLVEDAAQTTHDNARLTAALLAPHDARRVWLVTQPFHGRRAARLFRRAGLEPRVWHIADSLQYRERGRAVRLLAREYAAWAKLLVTR